MHNLVTKLFVCHCLHHSSSAGFHCAPSSTLIGSARPTNDEEKMFLNEHSLILCKCLRFYRHQPMQRKVTIHKPD